MYCSDTASVKSSTWTPAYASAYAVRNGHDGLKTCKAWREVVISTDSDRRKQFQFCLRFE